MLRFAIGSWISYRQSGLVAGSSKEILDRFGVWMLGSVIILRRFQRSLKWRAYECIASWCGSIPVAAIKVARQNLKIYERVISGIVS